MNHDINQVLRLRKNILENPSEWLKQPFSTDVFARELRMGRSSVNIAQNILSVVNFYHAPKGFYFEIVGHDLWLRMETVRADKEEFLAHRARRGEW